MKWSGQNKELQKSESMVTVIFLILSGGFQDAYTYFVRGEVFANAQTGNIVLLGNHLASREWSLALRYLAPVIAFVAGVYVTEHIKDVYKGRNGRFLHWRQIVVLMEIMLLLSVGFLPQSLNMAANMVVSFVCALQVNSFRKIQESPYASTMCIGNLRSAAEMLYRYRHSRDKRILENCKFYCGIIAIFAVGATMGSIMSELFGEKTIWVSCGLLFISFLSMFVYEQIEE